MEPAEFSIGQRVECKDSVEETWKLGVVVSLDPLLVQPDGWDKNFPWDEVRVPVEDDVVAEDQEGRAAGQNGVDALLREEEDADQEAPGEEDEAGSKLEESAGVDGEAEMPPTPSEPAAEGDTSASLSENTEQQQLLGIRERIKEDMRQRRLKRQAEKAKSPDLPFRESCETDASIETSAADVSPPQPPAPSDSSTLDCSETGDLADNVLPDELQSSSYSAQARLPSENGASRPRYCIVGSWSDWKPEDMQWDAMQQLYVFQLCLGSGGWESFQFLLDGDWNKCLHPDRSDACPYSFYNLCGPDCHGHELNWTIGAHVKDFGAPGARYEVRLQLTRRGAAVSVDWNLLQSEANESDVQLLGTDALPQVSSVSPDAVPMPSVESRLDGQLDDLSFALVSIREREKERFEALMKAYDNSSRFPRFQDAQYHNRDQYEAHVRGEALKNIRTAVNRFKADGGTGQLWKITGGREKGGVVARKGHEVTSSELQARLSLHALVEELDMKGDRLHYKLISGTGPPEGWVTVRVMNQGIVKNLALKTTREEWDKLHGTPGESQLQSAPPQLVIVALMAVHISTSGRLLRFQHVLRSIEQQSLPWPTEELEFVLGMSWSTVSPELEESVQNALDAFSAAREGKTTVIVRQKERHSQFQHFAAALAAIERRLSERRAGASSSSIWLIFGDDDDLWHSKRVAEYVQAIRRHSILDAVAVFATTTRVNMGQEKLSDEDVPKTEEEVDNFIAIGRGKRTDLEEPSREWFKRLRAAGDNAATVPYQDDLGMEYFHLCPRLRVVQEFFATTSKNILAHRYCDLRFAEYLLSYPRFGHEFGLEVSWFEPTCWMYFYACPQAAEGQWDKSIECQEDEVSNFPPESVGIQGHMATEVKVEKADVEMAGRSVSDFKSYDAGISQQRLTRYWAAFRNYMELSIIPRHKGVLDQRVFDGCIYMAVNNSFGQFAEKVMQMPSSRGERAARMMFKAGQDFAKILAKTFEVGVLWHFPDQFMEPTIEDQDWANQQNAMPNYPAQPQYMLSPQPHNPGLNPWKAPFGKQGYPGQPFGHQQQLAYPGQGGHHGFAGNPWMAKHPTHFANKPQQNVGAGSPAPFWMTQNKDPGPSFKPPSMGNGFKKLR